MTRTLIIMLCIATAGAGATFGQDPPPPQQDDTPPPRMQQDESGRRNAHSNRGSERGPGSYRRDRSGGGFEAWMTRMKEEHPEEWERIQTLRKEDPQALHKYLRQRLQSERTTRLLKEDERLRKLLADLSEDDRNYVFTRIGTWSGGGSSSRGGPGHSGERRQGDDGIGRLAEQVRQAGDPATRDMLSRELRKALVVQHAARKQEREAMLQRMQAQLERLQAELEHQQQPGEQEKLIDRHLEALLSDRPVERGGARP